MLYKYNSLAFLSFSYLSQPQQSPQAHIRDLSASPFHVPHNIFPKPILLFSVFTGNLSVMIISNCVPTSPSVSTLATYNPFCTQPEHFPKVKQMPHF